MGKLIVLGTIIVNEGVVFGLGFVFGYFDAAQRQKSCVKLFSGQDHCQAWYLVVIITLVMPDLNTKLSS